VLAVALVLTALLGLFVVPPGADLPIHWGITGEADLFAPRIVALLVPLVVTALVWGVMYAVCHFANAEDFAAGRYATRSVLAAITGVMLLIEGATVLLGAGYAVSMVQVVTLGIAGLLLVLGNALPKSQPNSFAGIRLPTTRRDPRNWQLTHRLVGVMYVIAAPILAVLAFAGLSAPLLIVALLATVFVPILIGTIYSLSLARKG
jgi:uncharacterized membrane protein